MKSRALRALAYGGLLASLSTMLTGKAAYSDSAADQTILNQDQQKLKDDTSARDQYSQQFQQYQQQVEQQTKAAESYKGYAEKRIQELQRLGKGVSGNSELSNLRHWLAQEPQSIQQANFNVARMQSWLQNLQSKVSRDQYNVNVDQIQLEHDSDAEAQAKQEKTDADRKKKEAQYWTGVGLTAATASGATGAFGGGYPGGYGYTSLGGYYPGGIGGYYPGWGGYGGYPRYWGGSGPNSGGALPLSRPLSFGGIGLPAVGGFGARR